MPLDPNLRILVDGDPSRVYHQGDQVKGRVILVVEKQEQIKALKLNFLGACITKTTRPFYVTENDRDGTSAPRQEYRDRTYLFNIEEVLLPGYTLGAKKYCWDFDFTFPKLTETRHSRWARGSKFARDFHPLPPSFHIYTDNPGGEAMVSYYLQAKLIRRGMKDVKRVMQTLAFCPNSRNTPHEPRINSRILYAQTWKPTRDTRTAIDKIINKVSRKSTMRSSSPQIVPTLYYPEKIAPGQHIPLLVSITNARRGCDEQLQCFLDSLVVTISTYTTSMCGKLLTQPQDSITKHITCISKHDLNQPLSFDVRTKLTTNFRLVDDAECVPTFKTYTITRHYTLTIVVGLKCQGQKFTIKSTTPLEILPRLPRAYVNTQAPDHHDEIPVDPLPLYEPTEAGAELAPDYDTVYSLTPAPSRPYSFAETESYVSGTSTPLTRLTTPSSEVDRPSIDNRASWHRSSMIGQTGWPRPSSLLMQRRGIE
ncbi:uncharacterized protein BDR25DRAFT_18330 [Lindgomyces ingoldianus]|uniref:Uncharacterized protein n=1 Tax=Lindgomyces ingoldianus TaxID=673940 RepID=A0ACB6QZV3_9PLEO|nr:uncharacterized protein BDR25DRAFT_18330 [Lindgomyces ingoldianus]KAF2472103.1 hypothetical protein BDR25DRAFT_18330 [Lindgomyces ingoldianus]